MNARNAKDLAGKRFSMPRFLVILVLSLVGYISVAALLVPAIWRVQPTLNFWMMVGGIFFAMLVMNLFVEFFFHRYVLHMPLVPFLSHFHKQHTLHHALTSVRVVGSGKDRHVESHYEMVEDSQEVASFFPWYAFLVFALFLTPIFMVEQWMLPEAPIFVEGPVSFAFSLLLYESLHRLAHVPRKKWEPLLVHPLWGWWWRRIDAFRTLHINHHRDIFSNEGVGGLLSYPLADHLLGTHVKPAFAYEDGSIVGDVELASPTPGFIIRSLDNFARARIRSRGAKKALTR